MLLFQLGYVAAEFVHTDLKSVHPRLHLRHTPKQLGNLDTQRSSIGLSFVMQLDGFRSQVFAERIIVVLDKSAQDCPDDERCYD